MKNNIIDMDEKKVAKAIAKAEKSYHNAELRAAVIESIPVLINIHRNRGRNKSDE